jgi:hypothetical protein
MRFYMPYGRNPNSGLRGIMEKKAAKGGAT